jgi:hypothetical protein
MLAGYTALKVVLCSAIATMATTEVAVAHQVQAQLERDVDLARDQAIQAMREGKVLNTIGCPRCGDDWDEHDRDAGEYVCRVEA